MEEKELIKNLNKLRGIEPQKDWVVFTKMRILGQDSKIGLLSKLELLPKVILRYNKFAFAAVIVFGFVAGAFTFAQNSLPGDPAFILKKLTERTRSVFASQENLPKIQLEIASKRLDDLSTIAKTNQSKKLAPAIQEFQANLSKAADDLASTKNPNVKDIASQAQAIKQSKEKIEALGVVVGGNDQLNGVLLQLISKEIKDLQVRTLNQEQQQIFISAVDDFNQGNYDSALEKILELSYPNQ
jgi:hypothetical protein